MKWRNQLLALFCLVVFLGLGVLYFKNWVVQKPFGIILFIGEGLDPARLAITRIYAADAATPLTLDTLSYTALLKNYSTDSTTPDRAAAATALATGIKVKNGTVGLGAENKALENLLQLAHRSGRMTGLVTDASLTNATAAAFYAHAKSATDRQSLARKLAKQGGIDVILGGGSADFLPTTKAGERDDGADLVQEMHTAGYDLVQTTDELEEVPRWRRAKLLGLFNSTDLAYADDDVARATQPTLADMVRRSIELLQFNRGGYLLVVDAGLMRKAAEANDADHALLETIELDRAVAEALQYAGTKSLVIVCGDVSIGGMNLNGFAPREASGGIWWGATAAEGPSMTWATGPNGATPSETPMEAPPEPPGEDATDNPAPELLFEPAAIYAARARENAADVIALGVGPGADALHGLLESTSIFEIIHDNL
ncbi:MAG: alkaline phosphatase [Verrucomicrobiota bacterium]|nr:alkaline phosphatase [Verrucomicrobiota bacterium]